MQRGWIASRQALSQIKQPSDLWDLEHYLTSVVKRSISSTTTGTRNSTLSSGDFSEKSGSMRKICVPWGRKSWKPFVLTPSSSLEWTQHDLALSAIACSIKGNVYVSLITSA